MYKCLRGLFYDAYFLAGAIWICLFMLMLFPLWATIAVFKIWWKVFFELMPKSIMIRNQRFKVMKNEEKITTSKSLTGFGK
tara:strand:+ start:1812 stop:2054 length:243 start_codon:yes stop_codon:yes gene_type:complete